MVQFGVSTVEAAMKLGREAAEYISGTFIKVSYPFSWWYGARRGLLSISLQFIDFSILLISWWIYCLGYLVSTRICNYYSCQWFIFCWHFDFPNMLVMLKSPYCYFRWVIVKTFMFIFSCKLNCWPDFLCIFNWTFFFFGLFL